MSLRGSAQNIHMHIRLVQIFFPATPWTEEYKKKYKEKRILLFEFH